MIVLVFQKFVIFIIGQNIDTFYIFVVFFVILITVLFRLSTFLFHSFMGWLLNYYRNLQILTLMER